jgi:hypothetical protein
MGARSLRKAEMGVRLPSSPVRRSIRIEPDGPFCLAPFLRSGVASRARIEGEAVEWAGALPGGDPSRRMGGSVGGRCRRGDQGLQKGRDQGGGRPAGDRGGQVIKLIHGQSPQDIRGTSRSQGEGEDNTATTDGSKSSLHGLLLRTAGLSLAGQRKISGTPGQTISSDRRHYSIRSALCRVR